MNQMKFVCAMIISFLPFAINAQLKNAKNKGRGPCHADVQKFCKDVQPGQGRIIKCLEEHKNELSPACKARKEKAHAEMKDRHQACKEDFHKFCEDIEPGQGRIKACMEKHKDQLSPECKKAHKF